MPRKAQAEPMPRRSLAWVSSSKRSRQRPAGLAQSAVRPATPENSVPTAARRSPKRAGHAPSATRPATLASSAATAAQANPSKESSKTKRPSIGWSFFMRLRVLPEPYKKINHPVGWSIYLAGALGLEPRKTVLETVVMPFHHAPNLVSKRIIAKRVTDCQTNCTI